MSISVIAVTVSITVACQLIVRQTWVCLALPIGPLFRSRGIPFHQSMNPVSAAPRLTMNPATITNVAATKKSRAFGIRGVREVRDQVEHGGERVADDREVGERRMERLPREPSEPLGTAALQRPGRTDREQTSPWLSSSSRIDLEGRAPNPRTG